VTGSLVSPALRQRVRGLATPLATTLGRLGLSPNALTVIGFAGTCVAAYAATQQAWTAAGVLVLLFGAFDMLDGALARATGRATRLGAFLDSVLDRSGEAVVYVGLVWGTLDLGLWLPVVLTAWAMAAAMLVSYVRAKAESLGFSPGSGLMNVGLAPREVRVAILGLGLIRAGFVPGYPEGDGPGARPYPVAGLVLEAALGLIAVLATVTVIQRILHVRAQAREG
jgi:CDP-diacylglycerol--glycerol-3-phosphate 3-phosphatidyltransferase